MSARSPLPFDQGGIAPWHMWGTTKKISLNAAENTSGQICKINYKRPETWSFFFGARILSVQSVEPTVQITVVFDVIVGVGRTFYTTVPPNNEVDIGTGFAPMRFGVALPFSAPSFSASKFRTTGLAAQIDDITPLAPRTLIEWLPAQDIQCFARGRVFPSGTATVEATAWFAPRSHVRPDWFRDGQAQQFRGGETDGT